MFPAASANSFFVAMGKFIIIFKNSYHTLHGRLSDRSALLKKCVGYINKVN